MSTDPAERARRVRDEFLAQQAKMPTVDHNGRPIDPAYTTETEAVPVATGVPAPNPALGSSASGAPDTEMQIADAQRRGDWKAVIALLHSRPLDAA